MNDGSLSRTQPRRFAITRDGSQVWKFGYHGERVSVTAGYPDIGKLSLDIII